VKPNLINQTYFIAAASLVLIIGVAIIPYWPGITGPFMLDSIVHIQKLERFTDYPAWQRMFLLATAGDIGSPWLSRPLSFLTLMIDDWDWPTDPRNFKYTNILIHALNAVLIFWLLLKLSAIALGRNVRTGITPLVVLVAGATTVLWAAHPLQVSTVLYVIQRMTELGALFSIAALLSFLAGRLILAERPGQGYALMTGGMLVFTTLGFLSKQIAVLVFVYVLVIEFFLLRPNAVPVPRHYKYWLGLMVVLPILLVLAHLVSQAAEFALSYETFRDFSLTERLLTEARILFDYLHAILLPRVHGTGLYHDDYLISTGLLSPPTTLLAILGIVGLIGGSVILRRQHPVLAFGIMWFFAGHLLESTAIPIELYFEHRNYLPMLGPLFVAVYYAMMLTGQIKLITRGAVLVLILILPVLTAINSWTWGDINRIITAWVNENPTSKRSNAPIVNLAMHVSDKQQARQLMTQASNQAPESLSFQLTALRFECRTKKNLAQEKLDQFIEQISKTRLDNATSSVVEKLVTDALARDCPLLTPTEAIRLLKALLNHPQIRQPPYTKRLKQIGYNIAFHLARLYEDQGHLTGAMAAMEKAYSYFPYAKARIRQARYLNSIGQHKAARLYLQKAKQANCPSKEGLIGILDNLLPCEHDREISDLDIQIQNSLKNTRNEQ